MGTAWITNGSTSLAAVINPLAAGCDQGHVPESIYFLDNPGIEDQTGQTGNMMKTIVTAYGGKEPSVDVTSLENELAFESIIAFIRSSVDDARTTCDEVAIDVTPGRKFWSIISFRAGFEYDVDHVFYSHLKSRDFYGKCYPEIPRPAIELIDFVEVL